ncbi:hypothetical protein PQI51_06665 [Microbacterium esteraromaticum]|uniref:hypothetical protein n=1 Tax=Microbacterium esteraromaticum TaxID=57043 RepID=UPI0030A1C4E0
MMQLQTGHAGGGVGVREGGVFGRLLLYGYIFYVIYAPPLPIGGEFLRVMVLMAVPPLVFLGAAVSGARSAPGADLLRGRSVSAFLIATLFGALYVAIVVTATAAVSGLEETRLVQNFLPGLVVINAAVIVGVLNKTGHSRWGSFEVLLWMGAFQGMFSIAGALIESIHDVSRSLYAASGGANEYVAANRVYGVSTDFTYGTPIYHGIVAAVAIWYVITERKTRYVIPALLMVASSSLNARTGVLVFCGMLIIFAILYYIQRVNFVGVMSVVLAGLGAGYIAIELLREYVPAVYASYEALVKDTENLLYLDQYTGNYSVLIPEIKRIPEGLGLIFGEGKRLYSLGAGERTDIGFTNDLFLGGLVYVVPVYVCFMLFLLTKGTSGRILGISLVFAATVATIKGEMLHNASILFAFAIVKLLEQQALEPAPIDSDRLRVVRGNTVVYARSVRR